MQHPRKRSRHLLALAVILALTLMLLTTSLVSAANTKAQSSVAPATSCLSVQPAYQKVGTGRPADLTISPGTCPEPPSSVVGSPIVVIWGDGSVSKYPPFCTEVCRAYIDASHIYQLPGDYHPQACLNVATPISSEVDCTSVEIVVIPMVTPLT